MRRFTLAIVLGFALNAHAAGRFTSSRCHCSFRVPDGWTVVANPKAGIAPRHPAAGKLAQCAFGLRPKRWPVSVFPGDDRDFGPYAIVIVVTRQRFRDALHDAFFERVDELRDEWHDPAALPNKKPTDWMVLGRQASRDDATWIRSANWIGLRGQTTIGYYGKREGYWGMDSAYRAVLSNRHWRSATVFADNPVTDTEFDDVVRSFRFD